MGTTYHILHANPKEVLLKKAIDSLLEEFNLELSTYIDSSTISTFNSSEKGITVSKKSFFYQNLILADTIFKNTKGAFDPSVYPLVQYWGFGPKEKNGKNINDLVKVVGYDKLQFKELSADSVQLLKHSPDFKLDFSALAKGYGVDVVSKFLERNGIHDYLVEIGGETRLKGFSPSRKKWRLGINTPEESASVDDIYSFINLSDVAMATSGNYRNFKIKDGKKIVHTISPKTGKHIVSDVLSATVTSPNCAEADAYATAFMVLGVKESLEIVEKLPRIEAYFIHSNEKGEFEETYSTGMKAYFEDLN